MGELNKQFEAFPEIKIRLENGDVFFNERKQTYASEFSTLHTGFVNGAWYAFQEQQSKIEQLEKERLELESKYRVLHALGRMRAAVITAEKWSVLRPHIKKAIKCLDRKEKALRGECD